MIVITGGAGFIGSNLLAALEQRNAGLVVVDRLGFDGKWRNIAKRELVAVVPPEDLFRYLDGSAETIDGVFHLGAISTTTETDADLIIETNFTLSQRIWSWCADHRVRLIYASSAALYGDGSSGFDDDKSPEAMSRLRPLNAYGWSKLLFDRWVIRQTMRGYPCPPQWAGIRFFNVYGPNEYHKGGQRSVVHQIFERAVADEPATLFRSHHPDYPDGGQKRDFVWVDDVVDIMVWLYDHPKISGLFNAGTGTARSFADLAAAVHGALARPSEIRFIDTPETIRATYQYWTEANMARLIEAGYPGVPTPLEDGVRRYVQDFLIKPDRYR
jgi:ADP-L-glycero-D-manno-heptose 6-epimerase